MALLQGPSPMGVTPGPLSQIVLEDTIHSFFVNDAPPPLELCSSLAISPRPVRSLKVPRLHKLPTLQCVVSPPRLPGSFQHFISGMWGDQPEPLTFHLISGMWGAQNVSQERIKGFTSPWAFNT